MKFGKSHLLLLCITAFFAMAGGAILAPVLPDMVAPLDTTSHEIGLVISVYTISTAIFTLVIGHFVDRLDRKKVLVPCLLIYGLMGLASFFATNLQTLLILRLLQGTGVAGMMSLAMLIIGEAYSGSERLHAMGRVSTTIAIGIIAAPLIGGGLAIAGWNYPFLFYALSLPFALIMFFHLPETRPQNLEINKRGLLDAFGAMRDFRVAYTIFLVFVTFFLLYSVVVYVPFMLKEYFGYTADKSGIVLAFQGIAVIIVASNVRKIAARFEMISMIGIGFFLVSVAILLLTQVDSVLSVIALMFIFGCGYGLSQTVIDGMIVHISPPQVRGGVLSIHNSTKYVGMSLSPALMGMVYFYFGLQTVFLLAGLLALLAGISVYMVKGWFVDV
ncbi:MFS transporter [Methanohalophilus portucalensis]|uniref:MFS transporter n=2 Tax=Methanohalophilus portucalensis TaxID=39664 RepID=A0A1L9C5K0_9EURY|nr:MFS transporter [Methanohalophilus portucalensis]ATU08424.1 MFS transporter [Methanohalophilus portucalensis]OJH49764.1 major facilitator superfamily MFS_1 [Methanohalophilus portucalensis FDF-1]RNI13410.1 MFS transporter [Methanohalophilus portucalensis FDF-1]SMH33983.1 Predicted arabinose efflux permease, MFS family [Methanohalophilus portucalensis FDF-1]